MKLQPGFASQFLTLLEEFETRLLSWGFYDVSFNASEIQDDLLTDNIPNSVHSDLEELFFDGWTVEAILDEMVDAGLLYSVPGYEKSYRTRFAEGVRLIANLRQMFKPGDWANGPRLVSDIKVQVNPRRYPIRDKSADDCWNELSDVVWRDELQKAAFDALARDKTGKGLLFAEFQKSAFLRILSKYRGKGLSGSIVTAGTGSGKTKAFYVPAFLGLITELEQSDPAFTKVIATYPRNVLLADQLREAISESLKLINVLVEFGLRKITFGALLGTTPSNHWFEFKNGKYLAEKYGWKRVADGFVVPFVKSPLEPEFDLVWRDEDRVNGRTPLYRRGFQNHDPDIPDGVLIITREALRENPPDVFFLSVEMLNRELGNPAWSKCFGLRDAAQKPRLFLLDEIHAYEGLTGAQISWIIRRWRHWSTARDLHFAGLSATLKDAPNHLANVSGTSPTAIEEFTPTESELNFQDCEYGVAVKGDPSSGTSLLSTTIQTGMLAARLVTPRNTPAADREDATGAAFYGRKVFGFTDNLDGLNRWFSDMSDAERKRLASLRLHPNRRNPPQNMPSSTVTAMDAGGQIWELPTRLGHNLSQPLNVTRCSSQDPGLNAGSDIVIASASLEVGFDDPEVAVMLHHKRPMSISSFIQRKGRAGRRVGTRPWTVVVLSDYGADRLAFQSAEQLFQPDIERLFLPITNPYVLKIQAAYFLIDWLGQHIKNGSPYRFLSGQEPRSSQNLAKGVLRDFIQLGPLWRKFRKDFVRVFRKPFGVNGRSLSEAEIDAILWQEPRPLLTRAIPSLLRKLESGWKKASPLETVQYEDGGLNRPLPQFIPPATFSELSGDGAELSFEGHADKDSESLSIARALSEACPGRVSKRYSLRIGESGYWLSRSDILLDDGHSGMESVNSLFPNSFLLGEVDGVAIYQPLEFPLSHRPGEVLDSSNSFWDWESSFQDKGSGLKLPIGIGKPWKMLFSDAKYYLHRGFASINVTRFSRRCRSELRFRNGTSRRQTLSLGREIEDETFIDEGVGFRIGADGIVVELAQSFLNDFTDTDLVRTSRFRPEYFLSRLLASEELTEHMSPFLIEWVWQSSLAMLTATSLSDRCSLERAQEFLRGNRAAAAKSALELIFQMREISDNSHAEESRLRQQIVDVWGDSAITDLIEGFEVELWSEPNRDYIDWVRSRFVSTIAQALRIALLSQSPEIGDDDLSADVSETAESTLIYLTETSSGGLGQMERVTDAIRRNPEFFAASIRHAISFCPREHLDRNVLAILENAAEANGSGGIAAAFASIRSSRGYRQQTAAKEELVAALVSEGMEPSRDIVVAVLSRLVRPGSSQRSDIVFHLLNRAWRRQEKKLGISIDSRTFAYACVQYPPLYRRLRSFFQDIGEGDDPASGQVYNLLQQFLFAGCRDSCSECLRSRNRYSRLPYASRDLATSVLNIEHQVIDVDQDADAWIDLVKLKLSEFGGVVIRFPQSRTNDVMKVVQSLLAEELEVGFMILPIAIAEITRRHDGWLLTLEVKGHGANQ